MEMFCSENVKKNFVTVFEPHRIFGLNYPPEFKPNLGIGLVPSKLRSPGILLVTKNLLPNFHVKLSKERLRQPKSGVPF